MKLSRQQKDILTHLQTSGSITTIEACVDYGICRLSERIRELKSLGFHILSVPASTRNRYGRKVNFVRYRIVSHETECVAA